jgi:DNA mismatch endonuclease, patch repair protein
MDTVDRQTRSRIMASVGQKDTDAEMLLRRTLHKAGLRYRLHDRSLPGTPDMVFRRYNAVVFVHGCYWHAHGCYRSTAPKTRSTFWREKFAANRSRDDKNVGLLLERGWRVLTVWECALKGKTAPPSDALFLEIKGWLESHASNREIGGIDYAVDKSQSVANRY